jgi:hypothetical protein
MIVLIYLLIGFIVGFINWFILLEKEVKDRVSIIVALPLSIIFWPAIIVGWIYRLPKFIMKHYN